MSRLGANLAERLAVENAKGLKRARKAIHFMLARRDRALPLLAQVRNFKVAGAAGPLPARLYVPEGAGETGPMLVFFHGGGFVLGDIETHDAFCARLADAAKIRVVSCRYRLAPEAAFPAQLDDALAAFRWLRAHAAEFGGDADGLVLGGDSAGGYLAVAATAKLNGETPGVVKAQVLIYPLLTLDDDVWASSLLQDARIVGRLAVQFIRAQLATTEAPSLLGTLAGATPPTLLVAGGPLDPCRPDALTYAEKLRAEGTELEERYYPALPHGFINLTHVSAPAREAVAEIGEMAGDLVRRATAGD
ncbi:MAG: alpha/beta hydrolase [Caulobacter sp.]|nr:alpha/beta hydrolase [Caulobacter sp.]